MALLLDGVAFGLQLSLLAVGLTLIYGLGGVLNLAHGQFVAVAAILGARTLGAGLPLWTGLAVAVLGAGLLAWLVDATLMRPVYRREGDARVLLSLLLTLGVAFVIDGALVTTDPFTRLSLAVPGPAIEVFGVAVRRGSALASSVAIGVLLVLGAGLRRTRTGRAIRSIIQDEEGAMLCGIDPSRLRTVVFVTGGLLTGVVAVTQGMTSSVGATSGFDLTILALIVTVVGGLGRVAGALLAGLLLGVVHALASFAVGAFLTTVLLLLAAIAVVLVRPSGIFGRAAA